MALYCQGASASAASLSCKPVLFPSCTSCSYSLCSSSFEAICSLFQESLSCCTFWSDDISPKEKEKERRGEVEKESRSIQAYTRSLPVFICHGRLHFVFFLFLHCCYQMAFFFFLVRRAFSLSDLRHGTKNEENEKKTQIFFFFSRVGSVFRSWIVELIYSHVVAASKMHVQHRASVQYVYFFS